MKETTPLYGRKRRTGGGIIFQLLVLFLVGIAVVLLITTIFFIICFSLYYSKNKELRERILKLERIQKPPTCLDQDYFEKRLPVLTNHSFHSVLHKEIREKVVSDFISVHGDDGILYLEGKTDTSPIVGNRDNSVQNKNFLYLSGVFDPGYRIMIDLKTQKSILFAYKVTAYDLKWSYLKQIPLEEQKLIYGVDQVVFNNETSLSDYVYSANASVIYVENGVTLDFDIPATTNVNNDTLLSFIYNQRLVKHEREIEILRYAIDITAIVFRHMMQEVKFADFEFQMTGSFMENVIACGCFDTGYYSIMGSGRHASILHYQDNSYPINHEIDMLLIDAGAGFFAYTADISRTFPTTINGKFLEEHKVLYSMVLNVQEKLLTMYGPGVPYSSITTQAKRLVIEELLKNGFIHGNFDELVALKMDEIFFPHGLGHSMGLDVHDPGSFSDLLENMVITCEPGIYFIKNLIDNASEQQKSKLVMNKINEYIKFGGVRIEDDILITSSGYDVLTKNAPKTIDEIEDFTTR